MSTRTIATAEDAGNILMFAAQTDLPGVFAHNPVSGMVNGSLWTPRFDVFCYVFIAVLSQLRGLHAREVIPLAIATTVRGIFITGGFRISVLPGIFLSGSALSLLQKHVPVSFPAWNNWGRHKACTCSRSDLALGVQCRRDASPV